MPVDRKTLNAAIERAHEWLAMDPDPLTRREIQALLILNDRTPLVERFAGELSFGTAGLRGIIGGGPTRMNLVTVAQATAGLARQLLEDVPEADKRGVVLARDGRRKSPEFARLAAEVLAGVLRSGRSTSTASPCLSIRPQLATKRGWALWASDTVNLPFFRSTPRAALPRRALRDFSADKP